MAATLVNPGALDVQPDPILTNLMQDNSAQGDWLAPVLCPVKQVAKDYIRWGKQDSQSLLSNFFETLRTPGSRYNLLPRPVLQWVVSHVQEDAVRVEYTQEDVNNSISPLEPAMNAAQKILNVLQYATESRVYTLAHAATLTDTADSAWNTAGGSIQSDIESAKLAVRKATGLTPNAIAIAPSKIPGMIASTELKNLRVFTESGMIANGGLPPTLFGLKLFSPGARTDTAPTGTFTPAWTWDTDSEAYIFYTPNLAGGYWSGDGQAFCTQFENQLNGSAYEARTRLDPNFEENLIHIVYGNRRASTPELFNAGLLFRLTAI